MKKVFFLHAIANDNNEPNKPGIEISEFVTLTENDMMSSESVAEKSKAIARDAHNSKYSNKIKDNWNIVVKSFNAL